VLIAAGAHHGAGEVIDGGIGNNVIRFTSTVAGSLVLAAGVTNIAEVEASDAAGGNGGTAALNIDASALASGLTLTGNAGANSLTGTAQADTLNGLGGNDTLIGGDGNDTLNGGVGKDSQQGGAGDDLVLLGSTAEFAAGEVIDGGVGADTLRYTGAAAATLTLTAGVTNVEVVELLAATGPGTAAININAAAVTSNGMTLSGNNGTNILSGTNQADTLIGNGGADNMMGGGGDDLFLLGATTEFAGGERLTGGDGFDTLRYTGNAPATLTLTALVTTIEQVQISDAAGDASGTAAININAAAVANGLVITGNAGNNALTGTAQADTITGGGGADNLNALNGDDLLQLGSTDFAAGEVIDGGEGTDTLRLTGAGQTLDLTAIPDTDVLNIEIIDLAGGGNTLNLTSADVLGINAGQTLRVNGNAADSVFTGDAWTEGGIQTIGGNDYTTYTNGGATLLVDTDVLFNGIELASLDGTDGFKLNGAAALDQLGESTSGAGDVNGDGFDDLIIGAWGAASNGGFVGASYVVFGKASGFEANFELSALDGTNGFKLSGGAAGDRSGISVRSAGDVNGDGFGDVIVGAYRADPNGITDSGASYVVFGKDGVFPASVNLSALTGTDGFRLSGVSNADVSGVSVSGAGDVNGDGFADIIIGAYGADPHGAYSGASYVIFGKADGFNANLNLSALNGSNGFKLSGEAFPDASGISVSGAGDVNGDGFDDIIIGAYRAIEGGNGDAGATYVVFGKSSGFSANIDLSSLTGSDGFKLSGPAQGDRSGRDVSSAGDVNGDGFDDVIIATHRANLYGSPGNTYVVFGKASGFAADTNLSSLDGNSGFTLTGAAAGDFSGRSVGGAGDVNGDGYADLIVGSRFADPNGATSGESYVIFGRSDAFPATIDLSALSTADGLRLRGEAAGDYSGASVSAAGDVNGDGFGDLLVGAYLADPNGTSSGASYVVFGYDARHEVDLLGDDQSNSLTGTGADEILIGGLGNDTLDGAGGTDVLKGGAGNDNLVFDGADRLVDGGSGVDTLQFVSTDQLLDLTAIANNKYTGIEVIDLTGTGDNSLTLETLDLLALSDTTNTLRVDGNAGDAVISQGQGWVAGGQVDVGGTLYQSYADGAATLLLQLSIVGDSLIS
jgi:Ca2+-binding RTX toxin-like protein